MPPGSCKKLENFEPAITGGYRRINGFSKYDSNELSGSGAFLGIQILGSSVIGARGEPVVINDPNQKGISLTQLKESKQKRNN